MEHVEVLRHMKETIRAIMPSEVAALDAAIAALSAPQPPAEAQPVAWQYQDRNGKWHEFTDESHRLNTIEDGSWPIRPLYAHPPPSAPVGVEGFEQWYARVDARFWNNWDACNAAFHAGKRSALSQQPAAETQARPAKPAECADGCPDQQVCDHCQWPPGPDQQPAAVDGVRGLVAKWREEATAYVVRANEKDKSGGFRWAGWMRDELRSKAGVCKRHADELESALAGQQGGSDNDR